MERITEKVKEGKTKGKKEKDEKIGLAHNNY